MVECTVIHQAKPLLLECNAPDEGHQSSPFYVNVFKNAIRVDCMDQSGNSFRVQQFHSFFLEHSWRMNCNSNNGLLYSYYPSELIQHQMTGMYFPTVTLPCCDTDFCCHVCMTSDLGLVRRTLCNCNNRSSERKWHERPKCSVVRHLVAIILSREQSMLKQFAGRYASFSHGFLNSIYSRAFFDGLLKMKRNKKEKRSAYGMFMVLAPASTRKLCLTKSRVRHLVFIRYMQLSLRIAITSCSSEHSGMCHVGDPFDLAVDAGPLEYRHWLGSLFDFLPQNSSLTVWYAFSASTGTSGKVIEKEWHRVADSA